MSISYVLQVEKENNDSQPQSFHMLCDDSNSKPKLLTNVEAKLISHIPHTIDSQVEHAMKPSVNVLLDSGNRCGHNLISSDAIKRLELKAVKRSPLSLKTFNNTEAEYDEEAIIRLSLPILRQDKEVYTCSYEFTCLVVQNLSVDVLISEKSIQELDLFARQFKLSALEQTSEEFINSVSNHSFLALHCLQNIEEFAKAGDLIKYAPQSSMAEEMSHLFKLAEGIIDLAHQELEKKKRDILGIMETLSNMCLEDMNKLVRQKTETLVTIHVHQRDVFFEI